MSENVYKVGDLVQLRCGGPAMVVLDPEYPGEGFYKGKAHVTWFDGNRREQSYFDHQVICPYGQAIQYVAPGIGKKAEGSFKKCPEKKVPEVSLEKLDWQWARENAEAAGQKTMAKSTPVVLDHHPALAVSSPQVKDESGAITTCSKHGIAHLMSKGCHYCCDD